MAGFVRSFCALAICVALAGCFMSETPLIAPEQASFPFERIVIAEEGATEQAALVRGDGAYVEESGADPDRYLFQEVRPGVYLVQVSMDDGRSKPTLLYAVVAVDLAAGTAKLYKGIATEEDEDPAAGRVMCETKTICLKTAQPLIDLALAAIDAGEPPQATYRILSAQ